MYSQPQLVEAVETYVVVYTSEWEPICDCCGEENDYLGKEI